MICRKGLCFLFFSASKKIGWMQNEGQKGMRAKVRRRHHVYWPCHPHPWDPPWTLTGTVMGAEMLLWSCNLRSASSCSACRLRRYRRITNIAIPTYATVAKPTNDPIMAPCELDPPFASGLVTRLGSPVPRWSPVKGLLLFPPLDAASGGRLLSGYSASMYWPKLSGLGVYRPLLGSLSNPERVQ